MATFFIHNFGCRATQSDAASIRHSLLTNGYRALESAADADIVVLNTCTVTAAADAEARESIRRIHRENPRARIIATGCYAQRAPEELAALPGVTSVVGNSHQHAIGEILARDSVNFVPLAAVASGRDSTSIFRGEVSGRSAQFDLEARFDEERTRPTLKIQDGCNHRCTYCVIPSVRGRSRSLAPERVLGQIRALVEGGVQEIVLSGIDLGSYGRDLMPRVSLLALVRTIVQETQLARLRLSSIEPMDATRDFAELVAGEPRIAPHFHMPLQSGADPILRTMHRWYRAAHYARRVEIIREILPDAAIGADVIVGFPGEMAEDHAATIRFISELPLSYLHVFSFSPRPGTEAAELPRAVSANIIHQRARELRALARHKSLQFRASQSGRRMQVLTLDRQGQNWTGAISGNYLNVRVAGLWPRNRWLEVQVAAEEEIVVTPSGVSSPK